MPRNTMLELDFPAFMDYHDKYTRKKNSDFRRLHYQEGPDGIMLFLKSIDNWEYFSFVPNEAIETFGRTYSADPTQAREDFKITFLSRAIRLKDLPPMPEPEEEEEFIEVPEGPVMKDPIKKAPKEFVEAEEANDYAEFLDKVFQTWLAKTLKFIDQTLEDELIMEKQPQIVEKTFGEFLQKLFNAINTAGFKNAVKLVIRKTMKLGIQDAEEELNQDIGFTVDFEKDVSRQTDRQLEGTLLSNGERWVGIKGVTRQVQQQISETVKTAIDARKGIKTLKNEIRDLFGTYTGQGLKDGKGKVTEGRVMRIARTETNRYRNGSKMQAMKKAGIKFKTWDALNDNKTSALCERLEAKYKDNPIPIDGMFLDDTPLAGQVKRYGAKQAQPTNKSYPFPPAHPSCRSRVSAAAPPESEE